MLLSPVNFTVIVVGLKGDFWLNVILPDTPESNIATASSGSKREILAHSSRGAPLLAAWITTERPAIPDSLRSVSVYNCLIILLAMVKGAPLLDRSPTSQLVWLNVLQ